MSLAWMTRGYEFFLAQSKLNDDADLDGPSQLPGWTGRRLLSHVGHDARALARLAHWARTGEPTPMYPSPDARSREIEAGAAWPVGRLVRYSWIVEPSGASVPDTNQYPKRFQISGAILSISRFPTHSG